MAQTATITKAGQITVPKWVREAIGAQPGQRVVFRREDDHVIMMREKSAAEIATEIDQLIPDEAREYHMQHFAGLTAEEASSKWLETSDAAHHFKEEAKRTS